MTPENNDTPETKDTLEFSTPGTADEFPEELRDVDPAKLEELRNLVTQFAEGRTRTESGSEAPDAPGVKEPGEDPRSGKTVTGADVDWSEYDLEFNLRHLYPRATLRETPEGPRWVVMLDEFFTTARNWDSHGKRTRGNEPLNLGEYLGDMVNSPEAWRPITFLPDSYGRAGVLLHRQVPMVLPNPKPLEKTTEVEPPRDPELQEVEDAALDFMEAEGLTPEPSVVENEGGANPLLVENALALNPPTEVDPGPIGSRSLTDEQMKANADALREQIAKAREGEDFGEVK